MIQPTSMTYGTARVALALFPAIKGHGHQRAVSAFRGTPGHAWLPKSSCTVALPSGESALNVTASSAKRHQTAVATLQKDAMKVAQSELLAIAESGEVVVPSFARELTPDTQVIIHLGVGGFFRSHQALYLHRLIEKTGSNWAFVGMGVLDFDLKMYESMKSQDCLYTLVSKGESGMNYTVVGSMLDFVFGPDDVTAAIERIADLQTKIVSLTITEKGYCWDSDGHLDLTNEYVIRDMQDITKPASAMGFIVAALRLRKARGQKPFTVMSCDNMPDNGHVARRMCSELAEIVDPELAGWITEQVPFPVTMVDRITPITMPDDISELRDNCNIEDKWPVVAEDFMQWVIEDKFVDGNRPVYEAVGALVVDDVTPYEFMKLRLLNGGHSALSYASFLLGHREVHLAMADPRIVTFLQCYFAEVGETIPAVPGVDIDDYKATLLTRFSNIHIKDQVQRLTQDGSAKLYNTMKDPILELLAQNKPVDTIALAIAGFGRYITGVDEEGELITILDPLAAKLTPLACDMFNIGDDSVCLGSESTKKFIHAVFGTDLSENEKFLEAVEAWACIMREEKTAGALESLCFAMVTDIDVDSEVAASCMMTYDDVDLPDMPGLRILVDGVDEWTAPGN